MMGMIVTLSVSCVLSLQTAQEPQTAPRADVQRLLALTGELKQAREAAVATAMQITEKLRTRDIPPRAAEIVREMIEKEFDQAFGPSGQLARELAEAYARHYTVEEVTALIAFYESPLGRKVIETGPMIVKEAMPAVQKWATARMPQLAKELQERLRTEGIIK